MKKPGSSKRRTPPGNAEISELLAREVETASHVLQRAYRRAARSAFRWPEEARDLVAQGRSLTELPHVGPFLEKKILEWIRRRMRPPRPVLLRKGFLTLAQSRRRLAKSPSWRGRLRGDLQMLTCWSDGAGDIGALVDAALARGYEFIAITDHSKGLSIANGLNEVKLAQQAAAIEKVNRQLKSEGARLTVLRSIEMNLSPAGMGDMEPSALSKLDLVLGAFHSSLRR